jgi:hypothetical protein
LTAVGTSQTNSSIVASDTADLVIPPTEGPAASGTVTGANGPVLGTPTFTYSGRYASH